MSIESGATGISPDSSATASGTVPANVQRSPVHNAFVGPNGIRAGWRLLIFLVFFVAFAQAFGFVFHHIPAVSTWHRSLPKNEMTAGGTIFDEGFTFLALFLATLLMTLIEKRTLADYYLPPTQAFGKRFWQGIPYGFAMLSLLVALIGLLHGFSIEGFALAGNSALKFGLLYALAFVLVGLFEEFSFRGYMQSTLGSGIGFWPAAIVLSLLFGAIHLQNLNEAPVGALMAGSFGVLAAFSLKRTGNIWFPIGMHAAWDWGETYFYSTPDSGFLAQGHLMNSTFQGAKWLTGGSVGPEGSVFAFVVLVLGGVGIHFLFPAKRQIS